MDITYLGHSSFKLKGKVATVITDPFDSEIGLKFPRSEADMVTVSHGHSDHNNIKSVSDTRKVIDGPGEYEVKGISILGYQSYHDDKKGEERGANTIYVIEMDGLRLCHLGDLGHKLSESMISEIGDIDVLMVPVGGTYTIGPKEANEIVSEISPYFVIPMHYQVTGLKKEIFDNLLPASDFLKETGQTGEALTKFSIKKEDIGVEDSTKVIVLEVK